MDLIIKIERQDIIYHEEMTEMTYFKDISFLFSIEIQKENALHLK